MAKTNNRLIIVAALIIVGVAAMLNLNSDKKATSTETTPFSKLALDELEKVEIAKGSDSVTLTKGEGGEWGVVEKGLIPLPTAERRATSKAARGLKPLSM